MREIHDHFVGTGSGSAAAVFFPNEATRIQNLFPCQQQKQEIPCQIQNFAAGQLSNRTNLQPTQVMQPLRQSLPMRKRLLRSLLPAHQRPPDINQGFRNNLKGACNSILGRLADWVQFCPENVDTFKSAHKKFLSVVDSNPSTVNSASKPGNRTVGVALPAPAHCKFSPVSGASKSAAGINARVSIPDHKRGNREVSGRISSPRGHRGAA